MLEFKDVKKIIQLYRLDLLDVNKVSALLEKVGKLDIEKIIKLYDIVMYEEEQKDLEWSMDEDQTGISRYDALDFDDICMDVVWRIRRSNKS